jgi:hypothetical protein
MGMLLLLITNKEGFKIDIGVCDPEGVNVRHSRE